MEQIKTFLQKIDMPEAAIECYTACLSAIGENKEAAALLRSVTDRYEKDFAFDAAEIVEKADRAAELAGVSPFTAYAVFWLAMTGRLKRYYDEKGYPEQLFYHTLKDFTYKAQETMNLHGVYGLHCPKWYPNFFNGKRVAFGNLQFEQYAFSPEQPFRKDGVVIRHGDPVLNVHLPRTGKRLDYEGVGAAYREAAEFFKDWFGERPVVFYCSTWLFFKRNFEALSETSNLRKFCGDYDIFFNADYDDYTQVWRLFDMFYTGDPEALPGDTSLRRFYKDLIRKGEKTGRGKGIYIYKS